MGSSELATTELVDPFAIWTSSSTSDDGETEREPGSMIHGDGSDNEAFRILSTLPPSVRTVELTKLVENWPFKRERYVFDYGTKAMAVATIFSSAAVSFGFGKFAYGFQIKQMGILLFTNGFISGAVTHSMRDRMTLPLLFSPSGVCEPCFFTRLSLIQVLGAVVLPSLISPLFLNLNDRLFRGATVHKPFSFYKQNVFPVARRWSGGVAALNVLLSAVASYAFVDSRNRIAKSLADDPTLLAEAFAASERKHAQSFWQQIRYRRDTDLKGMPQV